MPAAATPYAATALRHADGELADVALRLGERVWHLAGRGGGGAEAARALAAMTPGGLPVFVGAGLGHGIRAVRRTYAGPIFVLDRETAIDAITGLRRALADDPGIRFLDAPDPDTAAAVVADAARLAGFSRLAVVVHPVYPRLDPSWYRGALARLTQYATLRDRLVAPRFTTAAPKVLLLWRPYFLYREIETALSRLGVAYHRVATGDASQGQTGAVEAILAAVAAFQPDFALTVNHLGLDRDGRLAGLLADIGLPLASWFVDSPRLILHEFAAVANAQTMVFSYDADSLDAVRDLGFAHAAYLPLGTDAALFSPAPPKPPGHPWRAETSFVGASMVPQAADALARLEAHPALAAHIPEAAAAFAASPEQSPRRFLETHPDCGPLYAALASGQSRLQAELALTWEATKGYRHACVRALAPFSPLIVGDADWETVLPGCGTSWRRLDGLDYYGELPDFYPSSAVNLNCTSVQMKGAVNQRVFDVPACGAFVLTDARAQLDGLFEPGREVAVYADPGEIPDMVRHYLAHPAARNRIATAARRRILAEHTYEHRLESLLGTMRKVFGG